MDDDGYLLTANDSTKTNIDGVYAQGMYRTGIVKPYSSREAAWRPRGGTLARSRGSSQTAYDVAHPPSPHRYMFACRETV